MRIHYVTVFSSLICALMIGAAVIAPLVATPQIQVKVWYLPWWIDPEEPPTRFYAFIKPRRPYKPCDINPETIRLEGVLTPIYARSWWWFVARFDPDAVVDIVWQKICHLGIPPRKHVIYLKITGEFKDGTPFVGEGKIIVKVPPPPHRPRRIDLHP